MMKQILLTAGLTTMLLIGTSCGSGNGQIMWQDVGECIGGDVTGGGAGANLSEERLWQNPSELAEVNFDLTTANKGELRITITDASGNVVFDHGLTKDSGDDTFSGTTKSGTPGQWTVKVTLKKFKGDGSFSVCPVN
ncbi:MAG: hypothetical protein GXO48_02250 [Chlorobi bacterium]|nr:hypothetical protein [Chlorobiota bacterium]